MTDSITELKVQLRNRDFRNDLKRCPVCDNNVADREIVLFQELIDVLYQAYRWCGYGQRHEFQIKEIRHLMDKNCYARFGDLIKCGGGLVYRPVDETGKKRPKGWYGLNMMRCREFFSGNRTIPMQVTKNPLTGELLDTKYVHVREFPRLFHLLNEEGFYDPQQKLF